MRKAVTSWPGPTRRAKLSIKRPTCVNSSAGPGSPRTPTSGPRSPASPPVSPSPVWVASAVHRGERLPASDGQGRGLTLTGQLGDVMKESAHIALSYVRAHAAELGIEDPSVGPADPHPRAAGAVPKDGPSAGVTMVTALASMAPGARCAPRSG